MNENDSLKEEKRAKTSRRFWGIFSLSFIVLIMLSEMALAMMLKVFENNPAASEDLLTVPLYIMPFVALAFTGVFLYIMRKHEKQSQEIIDSMNKVAEGDYSVRVNGNIRNREFKRITENFNKMAKELSSVNTLREDFVREFSHEFKTPISSIYGFASLLLEGGLSEEEQRRFLQIIADESIRLRNLAENTLTLSKLENQQLIGGAESIKLDEQLNECIIQLAADWEKKGLNVSSDLQSVTVRGNGSLAKQVWMNLISNAIKFTPEGGEVKVGLTKIGDEVEVTVSDTGVGVPEKDTERIFEKYYRADGAKSVDGSGLGLAICKRICTLAGWEISASRKSGGGSVFTVKMKAA